MDGAMESSAAPKLRRRRHQHALYPGRWRYLSKEMGMDGLPTMTSPENTGKIRALFDDVLDLCLLRDAPMRLDEY